VCALLRRLDGHSSALHWNERESVGERGASWSAANAEQEPERAEGEMVRSSDAWGVCSCAVVRLVCFERRSAASCGAITARCRSNSSTRKRVGGAGGCGVGVPFGGLLPRFANVSLAASIRVMPVGGSAVLPARTGCRPPS
jgi:hypothetical protein